jgi:hypothetical protein
LNWFQKGKKTATTTTVPIVSPAKRSEEESSSDTSRLGREILFHSDSRGDYDGSSIGSSSVTSSSSLISSDDDDEDYNYDGTNPSSLRGMERLEKKYEKRDERLKLVLGRRQTSFEASMLRNEMAVREWQRKSIIELAKDGGHAKQIPLGLTSMDQLRHNFLFESQVNANGVYTLALYMLCTTAFYYILDAFLMVFKHWSSALLSVDAFYLIVFVLGVALMRVNGYLWGWLDDDSLEIIKLEMHNRDCLGYLDAKIFRWLKGTRLKSFSNIVCYDMAYIGLSYFYYAGMNQLAYAPATQWYSAVRLEVDSLMPECVGSAMTCEEYQELVQGRLRSMLAYHLCADPNWTVVTTAYHVGMFVLSASIYAMLGEDFITSNG